MLQLIFSLLHFFLLLKCAFCIQTKLLFKNNKKNSVCLVDFKVQFNLKRIICVLQNNLIFLLYKLDIIFNKIDLQKKKRIFFNNLALQFSADFHQTEMQKLDPPQMP